MAASNNSRPRVVAGGATPVTKEMRLALSAQKGVEELRHNYNVLLQRVEALEKLVEGQAPKENEK